MIPQYRLQAHQQRRLPQQVIPRKEKPHLPVHHLRVVHSPWPLTPPDAEPPDAIPDALVKEAAAHGVKRIPASLPSVKKFRETFFRYCAIALKHRRNDETISEFLYTKLKERVSHPEIRQIQTNHKPGLRRLLAGWVTNIIRTVHQSILSLAVHGRRIQRELPNGRIAFKATLNERSRGTCFAICEVDPREHAELRVVAIQTVREFDRHRPRQRHPDEEADYLVRPQRTSRHAPATRY